MKDRREMIKDFSRRSILESQSTRETGQRKCKEGNESRNYQNNCTGLKNRHFQIDKIHWAANTADENIPRTRNTIEISEPESKEKPKNFEREEQFTFEGSKIRMGLDLSTATLTARGQ